MVARGDGGEQPTADRPSRGERESLNYDPANPVRILGNGAMTTEEAGLMTERERKALN